VQAIIAPTNTPAWPTDLINGDAFLFGSSGFAAVAGYPLVTVTGGFAFDLPEGITFMASAWSEPTLISSLQDLRRQRRCDGPRDSCARSIRMARARDTTREVGRWMRWSQARRAA
jgi:amidase